MGKIIIAVGSTRAPKINAVREALAVVGPLLDPHSEFEIAPAEASSGVRHTPLSREEIMSGAKHRAVSLAAHAAASHLPWKYFVGLEGGLDIIAVDRSRLVFLENWAYVADDHGRGYFGRSGGILLPDGLARQVVDAGAELGVAIDEFAGGNGIRDAQGAWGVLTRNAISRQQAFRTAVIAAFAPFYSTALYRSSDSAATSV